MKIDIDSETLDGIVWGVMEEDLKMMTKEVKSKKPDPCVDRDDYRRYIDAIKTLQEWYGK